MEGNRVSNPHCFFLTAKAVVSAKDRVAAMPHDMRQLSKMIKSKANISIVAGQRENLSLHDVIRGHPSSKNTIREICALFMNYSLAAEVPLSRTASEFQASRSLPALVIPCVRVALPFHLPACQCSISRGSSSTTVPVLHLVPPCTKQQHGKHFQ